MAQIELLAHRGWWQTPAEKNSPDALRRAFAANLGIETDLRDCSGEIVISHDPPLAGKCQTLRQLLTDYRAAKTTGTLALNIKSDGLQPAVLAQLREFNVQNFFLFDMSIPDSLQWLKAAAPIFTRQSEFEPIPALYDQAAGIWLDAFHRDWFDAPLITAHLTAGKKVAVVSPELHGRDPQPLWNLLATLNPKGLLLCTDRIPEARRYFHAAN